MVNKINLIVKNSASQPCDCAHFDHHFELLWLLRHNLCIHNWLRGVSSSQCCMSLFVVNVRCFLGNQQPVFQESDGDQHINCALTNTACKSLHPCCWM